MPNTNNPPAIIANDAPEAVASHRLVDAGAQRCLTHSTLYVLILQLMPPQASAPNIRRELHARENELPPPLRGGPGKAMLDFGRDVYFAITAREIGFEDSAHGI